MIRRPRTVCALCVCAAAASGCGEQTTLHSVGAVQKAFAENRAPLVALEPTRVSTMLIPKTLARALGRPALARPLPQPKAPYYAIVITDRTWLRDLDRHQREAVRAVGGGNANFKKFSTRRDNVILVHPRGRPNSLARLKAALEDVD